jgi:hypothetical protein
MASDVRWEILQDWWVAAISDGCPAPPGLGALMGDQLTLFPYRLVRFCRPFRPADFNLMMTLFLVTDLSLAFTFLEVANASTNPRTRQRYRDNAQKAYDAVRHFLPQVAFTEAESKAVHEKV